MAVACEIGEPQAQILEHRVVAGVYGVARAVAGFDHDAAGFDLVAEHAVIVARGRIGEPGAADILAAVGNRTVGQGALGQYRRRRRIEEVQDEAAIFALDRVPILARAHAHLSVDGVEPIHARRRLDGFDVPIGGAGGRRQQRQRGQGQGGELQAHGNGSRYRWIRLSRSALPTTLTDDSAIAAAAMIGDNRMPNTG